MFLIFCVSNLVFTQDNNGDDSNRNTRTDPNPAASLTTETSTYHRTSLSREEGEDEDASQATLKLSRIRITAADDKGEAPQWMVDALKVGLVHATIPLEFTNVMQDNCAYFVEERPIPSISQQLQTDFPSENAAHEAYVTRPRRLFDGSLSILDETSTWALQRDDISRMKVISQLDRKFIVCVVDATSESNGGSQTSDYSKRILVLVDQHAASERVRVEGYLKTLCHHFLDAGDEESQTTFRVKLEPPRPVLLSRREVSMLRNNSQILQRWGFDLSWPESEIRDLNADQEVVLVHSVPQVVGEKVLTLFLFPNVTHSFTTSFSWETSCGISLENTQNSLESMMCFQPWDLEDRKPIKIAPYGTRRFAGVQRVYWSSSTPGHAEVSFIHLYTK